MSYKRLEIYVGWTCNQKCTYCMEFSNMEEKWNKKVTKFDILKKLIKYKKQGYNHVTFLGGEPFIQEVFGDALKLAKKMNYTILVTTNCTTLHIEKEAKKYLNYIDELIISIEAIDKKLQQKISRTNVFVDWQKVFVNIKKYWNGKMLKANIVITQDNKNKLFNLVYFLKEKGVKNIAITYPDINYGYYNKDFILRKIAPSYTDAFKLIPNITDFCKENNINLKIPDFPFCIFPKLDLEKYIKITDDFNFGTRLKITHTDKELDRGNLKDKFKLPRQRENIKKCSGCIYLDKCWGPSRYYEKLYGLDEIIPIKNY